MEDLIVKKRKDEFTQKSRITLEQGEHTSGFPSQTNPDNIFNDSNQLNSYPTFPTNSSRLDQPRGSLASSLHLLEMPISSHIESTIIIEPAQQANLGMEHPHLEAQTAPSNEGNDKSLSTTEKIDPGSDSKNKLKSKYAGMLGDSLKKIERERHIEFLSHLKNILNERIAKRSIFFS